jgi:hypothetical protein
VQCHASDKKEIDNTKPKTIFYALCVLYVLSVAVMALETGQSVVGAFVSNNAVFFRANQLCAQTDDINILLHMDIAEGVLFGCCDSIAQCILVRTTGNTYRFHSYDLLRYTVAGLCGVATSMS